MVNHLAASATPYTLELTGSASRHITDVGEEWDLVRGIAHRVWPEACRGLTAVPVLKPIVTTHDGFLQIPCRRQASNEANQTC